MPETTSVTSFEETGTTLVTGGAPMRVLVLDESLPAPMTSGKRLRTLNLLRRLAGEFQIEMVVHDDRPDPAALAQVEEAGIGVHLAPSRVPAKSGPLFPLRLARSLLTPLPYSVSSHVRPGYSTLARELAASGRFDAIHVEWSPYAVYLPRLEPLPTCVSAHNVESDIWKRMASNAGSWPMRRFLALQAARMERFERVALEGCHAVTAVSEEDARFFRRAGCKEVVVVPNGVDTEVFTPHPGEESEPGTIVFTGSMDWRPNQEAVRWFADEVHPHLAELRDYRLLVVGRNPPDWLRERRGLPSQIEATGTVPDVRPFMARAEVFAVPLRSGGGTRLKILEAMASGRAVVSTTVGAEGLGLEPGRHALIADDPREFALQLVRAMDDRAMRESMTREARRVAEERFDWGSIARIQADVWRSLVAVHRGAGR